MATAYQHAVFEAAFKDCAEKNGYTNKENELCAYAKRACGVLDELAHLKSALAKPLMEVDENGNTTLVRCRECNLRASLKQAKASLAQIASGDYKACGHTAEEVALSALAAINEATEKGEK